MSQLYIAVAIFLAGLSFGGAGAWKVQAWRQDSAELARVEKTAQEARSQARRMDVAAESFQARQQAADARETEVQPEVLRVITQVRYRDVCLDPDGMRILSDDAAASNARRGLAPALPAASGPG